MDFNNHHTIVKCLSGSRAYGTNTPTSDTDIRGIFCAPEVCIRTPFFPVKEINLADEEDGKMYELTNFMKLFVDQSPNILELMFVDEGDVLESTDVYQYLREQAPSLLSKKTAFTFSGYAMGQLKRIKGHNKWINNPQPEAKPTQKDFLRLVHSYMNSPVAGHEHFMDMLHGMDEFCTLIPYGGNVYAVIENYKNGGMFNKDGSLRKLEYSQIPDEDKNKKPMLIVKYLQEEHKQAVEKHQNYWDWKKNRNETRHQLEVDYGYDTKHGSHIVRLMRMAEEVLTEGTIHVKRPDAKELLAIRNGAWTYEEMLAWATEKDELIRGKLYKESRLPKSVDLSVASKILIAAQNMCWGKP